jgi:hypothetical protein
MKVANYPNGIFIGCLSIRVCPVQLVCIIGFSNDGEDYDHNHHRSCISHTELISHLDEVVAQTETMKCVNRELEVISGVVKGGEISLSSTHFVTTLV